MVLLELIERADAALEAQALMMLGMQGPSWLTPRSRQEPEVPRWQVTEARGVRSRGEVEVTSRARRRASARFVVRANIRVQATAGGWPW